MNKEAQSIKEKVAAAKVKTCQEKNIPKFLRKVFHILEDGKYNEYVSWSNDGVALIIKKPTEFADQVLPCYFKHSNFASFVRQLNMYNFKKKKNYHYDHVYSHEMFQKGSMETLRKIQRKCGETTPILLPNYELKTRKEDIEINVDAILQENLQYKRVQKILTTQLQFIETKVKDIRTESQTLHKQFQKQKANEEFLKRVIKNLSKSFGTSNIQRAVEAATEVSTVADDDEVSNSDAVDGILSKYMQNTEASKNTQAQNAPANTQPTTATRQTPQPYHTQVNNKIAENHSSPAIKQSESDLERDSLGSHTKKTTSSKPLGLTKLENEFNQQRMTQQRFFDDSSNSDSIPLVTDINHQYGHEHVRQYPSNNNNININNNNNHLIVVEDDEDGSNSEYLSWYNDFEQNPPNPDLFLARSQRDNESHAFFNVDI